MGLNKDLIEYRKKQKAFKKHLRTLSKEKLINLFLQKDFECKWFMCNYQNAALDLQQIYSHLGVEAFREDIQEQALKQIHNPKEQAYQEVYRMLKSRLNKKCTPACGSYVVYYSADEVEKLLDMIKDGVIC